MFENLKILRRKIGVTCDDMAKILGLKTRGAYNKKENGDVPFSLDEAKIISNYFKKTIEEIFYNNEVSYDGTNKDTG